MRPSSSPSDGSLFGPLFGAPDVDRELTDTAWLQAMLDAERALALANARAGLIPPDAAAMIAACCRADRFDAAALGLAATASGNPVVPLARRLGELVPPPAEPYVHHGATSQDILDTAAALIARRALAPIRAHLAAAADACATLAETHRDTLQVARTLLQHALPSTFGLTCAGWLTGLDDARRGLARAGDRLAVQLGGAAGTLAALGTAGPRVVRVMGEELGLAEPTLPWHTVRTRPAELAAAVGVAAGVLGTIARDVVLLAQTEVGEVTAGRGGSSAMPHKRNPVPAVLVTACAQRVPGLVATAMAAMAGEHQRSAGSWHAEWETYAQLLRLLGGAAAHARGMLDDLEVDVGRMRLNLDLTCGLLMAEPVADILAADLGRTDAHDLVADVCAAADGLPLRESLLAEPRVTKYLTADQIDAALDPAAYLGAAREFTERAVTAHRTEGTP